MIDVVVNGVSLDLDPECNFEIEMEQPMLDTDRMPVPYSTSISFLPTPGNCRIFRWLPSAMLEPEVKTLDVCLYAGGLPLFGGVLEYEGVEDGMINYVFSGKPRDYDLSIKLKDLPALGTITLAEGIGEAKSAVGGKGTLVTAPVMINKDAITDIVFESIPSGEQEPVDISVKYHNWPHSEKERFTPAISAREICLDAFRGYLSIDDDIDEVLQYVYLIGMYKPDATTSRVGFVGDIDLGSTVPDISAKDFVLNVLKMFGAAIFLDGNRNAVMRTASSVLGNKGAKDWDDKISDGYSLARETRQGYRFGYADDSSDNTYDVANLKDDLNDGDIVEVESLSSALDAQVLNKDAYVTFRVKGLGDIFSGKHQPTARGNQPLIDNLYHNIPDLAPDEGIEDVHDGSTEFHLVRCVPDYLFCGTVAQWREAVVPVIEPPALGEEPGSDVYVGLVINGQMCDHGVVFKDTGQPVDPSYYETYDSGLSLAPKMLGGKYHRYFSDWLALERAVVTADIDLSPDDLRDFRMYDKVAFYGREWIVRKLSITLSAKSDIVSARGEFVSIPCPF